MAEVGTSVVKLLEASDGEPVAVLVESAEALLELVQESTELNGVGDDAVMELEAEDADDVEDVEDVLSPGSAREKCPE